MSDVLDILEVERGSAAPEINKDRIIGPQRTARKPGSSRGSRRPEGMNRELYGLLYSDNKDPPPLFPAQDGQWWSRSGPGCSVLIRVWGLPSQGGHWSVVFRAETLPRPG